MALLRQRGQLTNINTRSEAQGTQFPVVAHIPSLTMTKQRSSELTQTPNPSLDTTREFAYPNSRPDGAALNLFAVPRGTSRAIPETEELPSCWATTRPPPMCADAGTVAALTPPGIAILRACRGEGSLGCLTSLGVEDGRTDGRTGRKTLGCTGVVIPTGCASQVQRGLAPPPPLSAGGCRAGKTWKASKY